MSGTKLRGICACVAMALWVSGPAAAAITRGKGWVIPTGGGTLLTSETYNSTGAANLITAWDFASGTARVTFPGLAAIGGHVQVTGMAGLGAYCKVVGWVAVGSDETVDVRCFDASGVPSLSAASTPEFALLFYKENRTADSAAAYLWANLPTTASYVPHADYWWSSKGIAPQVTRSGVGRYSVLLTGMNKPGIALVTAYGTGNERCQIVSNAYLGLNSKLEIACTKPSGAASDSMFNLAYMDDAGLGTQWNQHAGAVILADRHPGVTTYWARPQYSHNSGDYTTGWVRRVAEGVYTVEIRGLAVINKTVSLVSAVGSATGYCTQDWWTGVAGSTASGGPTLARVYCYSAPFVPADLSSNLLYLTNKATPVR